MRLSWLEDFLTLVQAGTFSGAAKLRHVTQPAFSRRIQMLEDWLGVELVDRRSHHLQLSKTATRFEPEIRKTMNRIYELRSHMRADALVDSRLSLTTQHTLMVSHLPALLQIFRKHQRETAYRVRTGNLEECTAQLNRGEVDLLLCFEAEGEVLPNHGTELARITVGNDCLIPVMASSLEGQAEFDPLHGDSIKLLSYPEESFLGRVVRRHCLPNLVKHFTIETVCESSFTLGIKEMALAGMGVAWLPQGVVDKELNKGELISLKEQLDGPLLTIALYRRIDSPHPALDQLWSPLEQAGLLL